MAPRKKETVIEETINKEEFTGCCSESPERKKCSGEHFVILLLLLSILSSIGSGYYFSKENSPKIAKEVIDRYLAIEYEKSGGKEIYDLLTEAQRLQLQDQIPQIKQFLESKKGKTSDTINTQTGTADSGTAAISAKKLTQDEIALIKETAYIEGNKDAIITLVEYSDLECPFCIRQYKDGTIKKTLEKFGDKANSIFKNFRGVPHENSEAEASALLCAWDLGGTSKYVAYYQKIFERSNGGNGTGFSRDDLIPLAKELKLDGKKFQACIDSKKNIARFDAETEEGKKLGVQGTPGTVVINNQTGEYELIAGAYPASEFERVINKLLGTK